VGLWTNIRLAAGDGSIPGFTACSLRCYTGTVHTIAASPLDSPLALESLLDSLFGSLFDSLFDSLLGRATLYNPALWEELSFPQKAFRRMKTLSLWKLWPIEGFKSVKALILTLT